MSIRLTIGLVLLGLLSACGSSETVQSIVNQSSTHDLKIFTNTSEEGDKNVGLVRVTFDPPPLRSPAPGQTAPVDPPNQSYYVLAVNIERFVANYAANPTIMNLDNLISDPQIREVTATDENGNPPFPSEYGTHYEGTLIDRREHTPVSKKYDIYRDKRAESVSIAMEYHDGEMVYMQIGGNSFSGTVPSGDLTYTGVNYMTNTAPLAENDGRQIYPGTFVLTANFSTGTGTIEATTSIGNNINASDIEINTSNGTFRGNSIELIDTTRTDLELEDRTRTGSIRGSFHEDGATGVSGVYYDHFVNESGDVDPNHIPVLFGVIAGARE